MMWLKRLSSTLAIVLLVGTMIVTSVSAVQNPTFDGNVGEPFEPTYRNFVNNALSSVASTFSGPTAPASPYTGQLWYRTTDGHTEQWNGTTWNDLTTGGGGGTGCIPGGIAGTLQASNGSGACAGFGGNGPLSAHTFANQISASGVLTGRAPTDTDISFSDVLTGNVSTSAHGFTPKAPNDPTVFLRGDGTWAVPPSSGGGSSSGASGTVQTSNGAGAFSAYAGSGPLAAHLFGTQISASGVLTGARPTDADVSFSDILTGNTSASAHGFVPKLPNDPTLFFRGDGTYAVPPGTGGGAGPLDSHGGTPFVTQAASTTSTVYTLWTYSLPGGTLPTAGQINIDATLTYTNINPTPDAPSIGIGWGATTLLSQVPVTIPSGSNTGMSLKCSIYGLGGASNQAAKCELWIDGAGIFESFNVTLTQNSASALTLNLQYQDTASGNSTVKLYNVRVYPS